MKTLWAVGAGCALIAALAGCGSSGSDNGSDSASPSSAQSSSATTSTVPTSGPSMSGMSMSSMPSMTTSTAPAGGPAEVTIKNFTFTVPASVAPGATIKLVNNDAVAHTFTLKAAKVDVNVDGNAKATATAPKKPGTYPVTCDYHSNMHANLVVK